MDAYQLFVNMSFKIDEESHIYGLEENSLKEYFAALGSTKSVYECTLLTRKYGRQMKLASGDKCHVVQLKHLPRLLKVTEVIDEQSVESTDELISIIQLGLQRHF